MKKILPLFVFIDACGWEIVRNDPFMRLLAPTRKPLASVLGDSSACMPSILSGGWPAQHRSWCYYVYDPVNSPFKFLSPLSWLPKAVTSGRCFRRWLGRYLRRKFGNVSHFDLYNIPFEFISLYDFTEKKSPLQPLGMNAGSNIFDVLERQQVAYSVSSVDRSEEENLGDLLSDVSKQCIDFAFLHWPGLRRLMRRVGTNSSQIPEKLRGYELWLDKLMTVAKMNYDEVRLYVFSDQGMANCERAFDLQAVIHRLPLVTGKDYAAVYDSTMARFWFFNQQAKRAVTNALHEVHEGRVLDDEELQRLGAFFEDHQFGELIFLIREGVLILPNHMNDVAVAATPGYHPDDKHSLAFLSTNQEMIPDDVTAIPHIFGLMERHALEARHANRSADESCLAGSLQG